MIKPDNFSKFQHFREEFEFFSYEDFTWKFSGNDFEISYSFNLSGKYFFHPKIRIPYKADIFLPFDRLSPSMLDNLVFHTGMIELISYWKAACPELLLIKPFSLSSSQVDFWKKIYYDGLGEFFYLNSIHVSLEDFMEINCPGNRSTETLSTGKPGGCLVPVGGGKDSAVTTGLLNNEKLNWLPLSINPGKTTRSVILAAGKSIDQTIDIFREIHPQLLELNARGFLNGHTPFSALLAFYSLLAAFISGRGDIILSNESSANEVTVPGTRINHQYSKSLEFEQDFRKYVKDYISDDYNYFSLLRPLSELQIAALFSGMPEFHHEFRSCNVGSKTDSWCGHCPKCLFTFIILSPFLEPEKLREIFGKNLLDEPSLENYLDELSGMKETKPFECIGTVEEVNLALSLAAEKYSQDKLPFLLRKHQEKTGYSLFSQNYFEDMLKNIDPEHFVPGKYLNILTNALR
jgi:UDP-N-acetyl-alpha-D-muramoyl-L-alanyl-L-glutamate epimerase